MALGTPTPVRLADDEIKAVKALSAKTKVTKSSILRMAIMMGLPLVSRQIGLEKKGGRGK